MSLVNGVTLEMVRNILNGTTPPAKLGSSTVGSTSRPIYLYNGTPTACGTLLAVSITGNAAMATAFSEERAVTLTGDVTGEASSTGGWEIETTLADSGVTAGTYGPSASSTTNSFSVPQITVDSKGRVTDVTEHTITVSSISTPVSVANGGTGRTSFTAYGLVRAGATTTGALQTIANGDSGTILQSNGASSVPNWVDPANISVGGLQLTSVGTVTFSGGVYNSNQSSASWASNNNLFIIAPSSRTDIPLHFGRFVTISDGSNDYYGIQTDTDFSGLARVYYIKTNGAL